MIKINKRKFKTLKIFSAYEPQPVVPTPDSVPVSSLAIEDDRRTRRRGSQL